MRDANGDIDANGATDLAAQGLSWRLLDLWQADGECHLEQVGSQTVCLPNYTPDEMYAGQDWPVSKGQEHQMFNFIRQSDGTLYLAGATARSISPARAAVSISWPDSESATTSSICIVLILTAIRSG
jgi:hypothetical protein